MRYILLVLLVAALAVPAAAQLLYQEVQVAAAAAGRSVKIPRALRPVKKHGNSAVTAAAAGDAASRFPLKLVSVDKELLLSQPAELLLLLPGHDKPVKAVHRPEVPVSPGCWFGELAINPAPSSSVVVTVSPTTGLVYGDVRYNDPETGEPRSYLLQPVVWEDSSSGAASAAAAAAAAAAHPPADPRLSAVIEHAGTPHKKNVPITPPPRKKRKPSAKTVRGNKGAKGGSVTAAAAAAYADKLERFKQLKRQQRAAAGLISSNVTAKAYSTLHAPRFAAGTIVTPKPGLPKPGEEVDAAAADPQQTMLVIDVLIVATPNAINNANGQDALGAMAVAAIANANSAYQNSGINLQLRLIDGGVRQVVYDERGRSSNTIVSELRNGGIANVQQWREETGADIVVLYNANSEVCGVGYFSSSSDGKDFRSWAFAAVMNGCWDGFTTTHEIGHIQGCTHDWDVDWSSKETYPEYAHGYKACSLGKDKAFRTIMSYGDCGSFRSQRVALISNPDKTWNGVVTGDAQKANCARRITNTAPAVSTYRTAPGGDGGGGCAAGSYTCSGVCIPSTSCCPAAKKATDPGACGWDQVCNADSKTCRSRCSDKEYACGTETNHATDFCIPYGTCCTRLPDSCIQPYDCPADGGVCTCPRGVNCGRDCPAGQKQCDGVCIDNASCCSAPDDCGDGLFCEADGGKCVRLCDLGEKLCDGQTCIKEEHCCLSDPNANDCPDPFYCPNDDQPCACSYDDPLACCDNGFKACNGKCIPQDSCCTDSDCSLTTYCPGPGMECAPNCAQGWTFCGDWCYEGNVCCLTNPGGDDCGTALTGESLTCPEDGDTCRCPSGLNSCPAEDGSGTSCIATNKCCPALNDCSDPYVCIDGQCSCPAGKKDCYNEDDDEWSCIDKNTCCVSDQDCPAGLVCEADGKQCKCGNGQSTCRVNGTPVCYVRSTSSKTCCTEADCTAQASSVCKRSTAGALLGSCAKCARGLKPCQGRCIRNALRCIVKRG